MNLLSTCHEELLQERHRNSKLVESLNTTEGSLRQMERSNRELHDQLDFLRTSNLQYEEQIRSYEEREQIFKLNFEEIERRSNNLIQELDERDE